jgi:very-short-patch-repair endonuclease
VPKEPRQFARALRKAATPAEDVLWQALRARRLHGLKFRRQVPILAYTVDFLCFERKLVVEVDGKQHQIHDEYDGRRTQEIGTQGLAVLRFGNWEVLNDLDGVLKKIAAAATAREITAAGPSPLPLSHSGEGNIRARNDEGQAL